MAAPCQHASQAAGDLMGSGRTCYFYVITFFPSTCWMTYGKGIRGVAGIAVAGEAGYGGRHYAAVAERCGS